MAGQGQPSGGHLDISPVAVHALDARVGGDLNYDMIADAPEQVAAMKAMGMAVSHGTHGIFVEVEYRQRLKIQRIIEPLVVSRGLGYHTPAISGWLVAMRGRRRVR